MTLVQAQKSIYRLINDLNEEKNRIYNDIANAVDNGDNSFDVEYAYIMYDKYIDVVNLLYAVSKFII